MGPVIKHGLTYVPNSLPPIIWGHRLKHFLGAVRIMPAKTKIDMPLRAVVYQHENWWIAHCLEMDLVAEGKTPAAALNDLMDLSLTHIEIALEQGDLESIFRPAPPEIWRMFSTANEMPIRRKPRWPVTRFEAREAAMV